MGPNEEEPEEFEIYDDEESYDDRYDYDAWDYDNSPFSSGDGSDYYSYSRESDSIYDSVYYADDND